MTVELIAHLKAYIQPFERRLAMAELTTLAGAEPQALDAVAEDAIVFAVASERTAVQLAQRLAYWEVVAGPSVLYTDQSLYEASTNIVRNGIPLADIRAQLPFRDAPDLPNRRCLRFGMHGIHEYRGKFFPQLVKSLINVAKVPMRGVVADPMCGSGTTIVEAAAGGFVGIGADINPLSVLMTRTKAALLSVAPVEIENAYEQVRGTLLQPRKSQTNLSYFQRLPSSDQAYLRGWFSEQVLRDLDHVAMAVTALGVGAPRDLCLLSLSNILRSVSWQKDDDLRVRKEVRFEQEIDPVREFLEDLGRSVRTVLAFQHQFADRRAGAFSVVEADARAVDTPWNAYIGRVDAIITSPPYATALPYLDTDRLSLSYLGLLPRGQHRFRDQEMIGNREVSERQRRQYWTLLSASRDDLPISIVELLEQIHRLNSEGQVGFRRRNLASLLAKYFLDMRSVLQKMHVLLKPQGDAFVVVGDNSTTAGKEKITIATSQLLAELAARVGFEVMGSIPMEMLTSRDIFRRNAMGSERIIHLKPV
jgi:tRNA G10  N-methylase Trm11